MVKTLNETQIQQISGGAGPEMFTGLIESIAVLVGVSIVAAFGLGAAAGSLSANYYSRQA